MNKTTFLVKIFSFCVHKVTAVHYFIYDYRFFGITSPKYYYELEEFKKMQLEEEERKQKEAENTAGWLEQGSQGGQVMDQPQQLNVSDLKPTELKYYQVQNENPFCESQTTTELDAESPT